MRPSLWGAILLGVALIARHWGSVLQAGLSIASIIYGSLLGVFLLGLLTKRVGEIAAMCAMVGGLALMLYVRFFTPIAWTWYVLIGTSATFARGAGLAFLIREKQCQHIRTTNPPSRPPRALGLWAAIAMVIGTAIGSGIFLVPSDMIRRSARPDGFRSLGVRRDFDPVRRADLRRTFGCDAGRGGEYVYLTAAYGPFFGFIYGWTQTWVAKPGSAAALASGAYRYLAEFFPGLNHVAFTIALPIGPGGGPLEIHKGQVLGAGLIILFSAVNMLGTRLGGGLQVVGTGLKVALIAGIILGGLATIHGRVWRTSISSLPAHSGR